jgi:HIRAN domain
MNRSAFLKKLLASIAIGKLPVSETKDFRKIYLLQCFLAGFRYYEGMRLLNEMKEGDLLALVREPDNAHDSCAIALHWQGKKIGYIPSAINEMLSYLLDAEALSLFAVITHLEHHSQPWENVAIAVYFVQEVNKDLPAHASYLTRIEAPHYRTLHKEWREIENEVNHGWDELFETDKRVINLDAIPDYQTEARVYFETHYLKNLVQINQKGRYVQVPDDGIYEFMYDLGEDVNKLKDEKGNEYLEFFLV